MQSVVYNSPLYYLLCLSVVYSMYIIIKLLSYYYYFIIIFFPHELRGLSHDPILVHNNPNNIIIIIRNYYIHTHIYMGYYAEGILLLLLIVKLVRKF